MPPASAVLADVVHVARRAGAGRPRPASPRERTRVPLLPMAEVVTRCYFRLSRGRRAPASRGRSPGCSPSTGSGSPASSSASPASTERRSGAAHLCGARAALASAEQRSRGSPPPALCRRGSASRRTNEARSACALGAPPAAHREDPASHPGEGDTRWFAAPSLARDLDAPSSGSSSRGRPHRLLQGPRDGGGGRQGPEAGLAASAVCASTAIPPPSAARTARRRDACNVVVPEGKVALGKMAQAVAHGARIVVLRGNFDAAWCGCGKWRHAAASRSLNSVNPIASRGRPRSSESMAM